MLSFGEADLQYVTLAFSTKRACYIFADKTQISKPFNILVDFRIYRHKHFALLGKRHRERNRTMCTYNWYL